MTDPAASNSPPAPARHFTAEAFFAIQAPSRAAASHALEATVEAITAVMTQREPELTGVGVNIQLCPAGDHGSYEVETS